MGVSYFSGSIFDLAGSTGFGVKSLATLSRILASPVPEAL
jgi:hypothetical protein